MLPPSLGTLLYFLSVQRTGHAATNQTLCYITTGCSRMSYLVLKHNPVPLACFHRDIYCCSYNSSSPAAASKSQGAIKWPFLFLAAWRRHKQNSHRLRSQTGKFLPRRHSLRVPAMAEDVGFEVVLFTRSRVCISICPPPPSLGHCYEGLTDLPDVLQPDPTGWRQLLRSNREWAST